ncbi:MULTISPECIES: PQQ-binding-like beta-propeller repeat protein [unclassified Clostridium]|uniref:outer membrane protein assembly factor BamB family protein n=1 Tax=Clostridium TaxID=1485 RepID=UPI001C8BBC9F|nr:MULTISPECIES: PQQ-binding-like beta-propeller repeat protein [unclassified Clostridium]MBX9137408.1 PQQ-binding-like beta-propeller repeat protein [Clostridium sp. K12(2020)]MBX9144268.1 PQQ-binding-like beta-propeller repeat protein [Clostridium sp. K13]MDU2292035.1 PQQ-binding-like beta-propeller repeat protein [Clostridium celatum]
MGKRIKILILMGMTMSLISCVLASKMVNNEEKANKIALINNIQEDEEIEVYENEEEELKVEELIEVKREIEAIDLEPNININYNYEVIGDRNICSDILFTDKYSSLEGIPTFRGNNFRNTASYGVSKISRKELNVKWKTTTSFSSWGGGAGWTGQPAIIKWNEDLKNSMNIDEKFKSQANFTEVMYASLDGKVYFLDLKSGEQSRNTIKVGNPIKGSLSIDSREIPMLYVGEGIDEGGTTGFNIYSLIDGSSLYEINGYDDYAYRGWPAFDSSALIYPEGDIVIEAGENGILYIIKLNTNYDRENNTVSINPETLKYRYYTGDSYGRLGIENSVVAYANLLYFADNNGEIHCIDLRKMEPMWIVEGLDDIDATITLEEEDGVPYLYIGDEVDHQGIIGTSTIRKINGLSGEVVWKNEFTCESVVGGDATNGGILATNVIGKNNISDLVIFSLARYDGFSSGAVIAMSKSTGEVVWETKVNNYLWSSPVDFYDEDGNGYIIQCDSAGNMFLIDGRTGIILNTITLDANIEASPTIYEDMIVIATRGGSIYGIEIR